MWYLFIRDRTMKKETGRNILIVLFATSEIFVSGFEISSQIDLDSEESERSANNSALKAFVNLNEGAGRVGTSPRAKSSAFASIPQKDFARVGDPKKRRSYFAQNDPTRQLTVINNIRIVVNGNETQSDERSCTNANGVCNVSVTSKPDDDGNIVTDVHFCIVTKLNTNQVGDIPVVDGVRGVENTYDHPSEIYPLNHPRPRPHLFNNIPQIQTSRQGFGESWYQNRGFYHGPQSTWYYHRPGERADRRFQGHAGWVPIRPQIDDKIEPPLSKTQASDE